MKILDLDLLFRTRQKFIDDTRRTLRRNYRLYCQSYERLSLRHSGLTDNQIHNLPSITKFLIHDRVIGLQREYKAENKRLGDIFVNRLVHLDYFILVGKLRLRFFPELFISFEQVSWLIYINKLHNPFIFSKYYDIFEFFHEIIVNLHDYRIRRDTHCDPLIAAQQIYRTLENHAKYFVYKNRSAYKFFYNVFRHHEQQVKDLKQLILNPFEKQAYRLRKIDNSIFR